jgi:hypothetical protein
MYLLNAALYFSGIALFIAAAVAAVMRKKISSPGFISGLLKFHITCLVITIALIVLWSINIHLPGQVPEIFPFWLFIFSGIFIFGFTTIKLPEKVWFGFVFFGHLFFSVIVIIPFIGIAITFLVYSYFLVEVPEYESKQLRTQQDIRGIMSAMRSPNVYIKCGIYELKRETHIEPVYRLDSVTLLKLDDKNVLLKFYDSDGSMPRLQTDTVACGCL